MILNILGAGYGVGDALLNGNGWQAAFRGTIGLAGLQVVRQQVFSGLRNMVPSFGTPSRGISNVTLAEVNSVLYSSKWGQWATALAGKLGISVRIINTRTVSNRGGYSQGKNEIVLNAGRHNSVEEMAITFIHEAIHAFGIKGTTLSEVIARLGSGRADTLGGAAHLTLLTILQYGGRLPLLGHGEGGLLVSLFSLEDSDNQ